VTASPWLISRRQDLLWLIGPALLSFALVAVYYALVGPLHVGHAVVVAMFYLPWAIAFDGSHAFATYSRSYLDRGFLTSSVPFATLSLLVFALGPALVLGFAFWKDGGLLRSFAVTFNRFALTWGYFHLCRQHWGIASLYARKAGEHDPVGRRLEACLLGAGLAFPYVFFTSQFYQPLGLAERLGAPEQSFDEVATLLLWVALGALLAVTSLRSRASEWSRGIRSSFGSLAIACSSTGTFLLAASSVGFERAMSLACAITGVAFAVSAVACLLWLAVRIHGGRWPSGPKWLLISSALLAHNGVFLLGLPVPIAVVAITIFHNLQYHRIVRYYSRNTYLAAGRGTLVGRLAGSVGLFIAAAVLFGAVTTVSKQLVNQLLENEFWNYLVGAMFWGIAFHHYVLDAVLWRPSRSTALARSLNVGAVAGEASA